MEGIQSITKQMNPYLTRWCQQPLMPTVTVPWEVSAPWGVSPARISFQNEWILPLNLLLLAPLHGPWKKSGWHQNVNLLSRLVAVTSILSSFFPLLIPSPNRVAKAHSARTHWLQLLLFSHCFAKVWPLGPWDRRCLCLNWFYWGKKKKKNLLRRIYLTQE